MIGATFTEEDRVYVDHVADIAALQAALGRRIRHITLTYEGQSHKELAHSARLAAETAYELADALARWGEEFETARPRRKKAA